MPVKSGALSDSRQQSSHGATAEIENTTDNHYEDYQCEIVGESGIVPESEKVSNPAINPEFHQKPSPLQARNE